jgi:hypothetical protein
MAGQGSRRVGWIGVGVVAILLGGLWALQGLNVVGGSSMTGNATWIWVGLVVIVGGIYALVHGLNRRQRS